jgi:hypothetical protein
VEALQRRVADVTLGRLRRTVIVRDVAERRVSPAAGARPSATDDGTTPARTSDPPEHSLAPTLGASVCRHFHQCLVCVVVEAGYSFGDRLLVTRRPFRVGEHGARLRVCPDVFPRRIVNGPLYDDRLV